MDSLDLGRLLMLRSAITGLTGNEKVQPPDAPSLTEGYRRMRSQVAVLVGDSDLRGEFDAMFPDLPAFNGDASPRGNLIAWHTKATAAATEAQRLLDQLAGWVGGLIDEQTLPERIQAEAMARVKAEQGFEGV